MRGSHGLRTHPPQRPEHLAAELGVKIEDHLSRDLIVGKRLWESLADPHSGGVGGDADMDDPVPLVVDDEEDIENAEGRRRYGEVHRGKAVAMVAQECHPTLASFRIGRAPWHVARDGAF